MNQMEFNVLKRAEESTRYSKGLEKFLADKGLTMEVVEANPSIYEDVILEYCKGCISTGLYEASREHMQEEFNRLCEFHRRKEHELVERFMDMTTSMLKENYQNSVSL